MAYMFPRLACFVLVAACGSDGGGGPLIDVVPEGDHSTYVLSSLDIPEDSDETEALGMDLDGDGRSDNGLGTILGSLAGPPVNLTFQGTIDQQIAEGGILILASLQATDLNTAAAAGFWTYLGADPSVAPCDGVGDIVCGKHLAGTSSFNIDPASPMNSVVAGSIAEGHFSGTQGSATFSIQFAADGEPINLTLVGARAELDVATDSLGAGRLAGAIPYDDVENEILPAIHEVMVASIGNDCGNIAFTLFDTDKNCMISLEEFTSSTVVQTIVAPDIDMFDGDGNFAPGSDGVDDAISVGLGFTAVVGTFSTGD
jgi:hypothetical protein